MDAITLRLQAAETYGNINRMNNSAICSGGAYSIVQRRLCAAMWRAKARWYRRSGMLDSAKVCMDTRARVLSH